MNIGSAYPRLKPARLRPPTDGREVARSSAGDESDVARSDISNGLSSHLRFMVPEGLLQDRVCVYCSPQTKAMLFQSGSPPSDQGLIRVPRSVRPQNLRSPARGDGRALNAELLACPV